jgi:hypothetical protein
MPAIEDSSAATSPRTSLTRLGRLSIRRLRPADLFDAWMLAETEATLALAAWRWAPRDKKGDAHSTYVAALDREAQAAGLLALRISPAA